MRDILLPLLSVFYFPDLIASRAYVVGIYKSSDESFSRILRDASLSVSVAPMNALIFDPPNVTATIGQTVDFVFPGDLSVSVTQSSSYKEPCTYLNHTNGTRGFDSGITTSIIYRISILDNEPIYFHCKHPGHCGSGMVGTINAPASGSQSFAEYQAYALQLGQSAPNDSTAAQPTSGNSGDALGSQTASASRSDMLNEGSRLICMVITLLAVSMAVI